MAAPSRTGSQVRGGAPEDGETARRGSSGDPGTSRTRPARSSPPDTRDTTEQLADVLLELTDTLGEEFDPADQLHELATASTKLLDVDGAGVLLLAEDGQLVQVAATDTIIDRLGHLQAETGTGPAPESVRARECVACPELGLEGGRWSLFAEQARGNGLRAVHAVPMSMHGDVVGVLLLFRHGVGMLHDADRRAAWLLATAAATGLVHRRAVRDLETDNGQLRRALDSRIAIEQAKGFLAASLGLTPDVAFGLLRDHARRGRQRLTIVAEAVVDRRLELHLSDPISSGPEVHGGRRPHAQASPRG